MKAASKPVLVAACEHEWDDENPPYVTKRCPGRLRFEWGMGQAACDTCGGWSGVAVSAWLYVDAPRIDTGVVAPPGHEPCWAMYARLEEDLADATIALREARLSGAG